MIRAGAIVVTGALFASAAAAGDDPFLVGKRELEKTVEAIALLPPEADGYFHLGEAATAALEEEVAARLEKAGYRVLPSSVLAGIRAEMAAQVGDATHPARQAAVREHALRELWFRHEIDAVGVIRVRIFSVPAKNDRVEWDGARDTLENDGKRANYEANVSVSSVVFGIYDAAEAPLYLHYGGLEPLMRREGGQLVPLPPERLLLDDTKIRKAAGIAVKPL